MRVIAGALGGRELRAPKGSSTRPTSDRVREALFSILGDLHDYRVLDLYAGSGALGIEALSRGAAHATFVESAKPALAVLRDNLERLGVAERATVIALPVERAGAQLCAAAPFDLVLCDPPWALLDSALSTLARLLAPGLIAEGGLVVVEHPTRAPPLQIRDELQLKTRRSWGDTAVSMFASASQPPENSEN